MHDLELPSPVEHLVQASPEALLSLCCAESLSRVQLFVTTWTVAHQAPLSMGDSPGKNTGVGCHALSQGTFPTQELKQAGSLLSELPGKPKNTGLGSLSLLQGIFQTQESNWDLLRCRWIFY